MSQRYSMVREEEDSKAEGPAGQHGLDVEAELKARLRALRPETYTGLAGLLAKK